MWILFALAAAAPMGQITFPVSGNAACKQHFVGGMLAMHSFMYDRATAEFQAASKADPRCAMGRWGEAMSYAHPLQGEEDLAASRKALAAVVDEAALPRKERAYLAAARTFFGDGDPKQRLRAWLAATEAMHRDFPTDDEVTLQLALALIANSESSADNGRLMRAAALGLDVFARHPQHPGAAHYVIHALDSPDHAILALPAAERYAKIAPAASHALHMPSHIFVQLGMWDRVAASNAAAWAASEKDGAGKTIDNLDWHTYSWMVASAVELGEYARAEGLVKQMRERLAKEDNAEVRFAYSLLIAGFVGGTGAWDRVDELTALLLTPLPKEPGDAPGSLGCEQHAPGGKLGMRYPIGLVSAIRAHQLRAEAALRRGDEAGVRRELDALVAPRAVIEKGWGALLPPFWKKRNAAMDEVLLASARAYRTKRDPEVAKAAAAMKAAIFDEGPSGGPAFDTPDPLQLGEIRLAAGKPAEALESFETTLREHPRMARALLGAARAALRSAQPSKAQLYYGDLAELWKHADAGVPGLDEARRGALSASPSGATPAPGRPGSP